MAAPTPRGGLALSGPRRLRALETSPLFSADERHTLFSPHAARDSPVFYGCGWFLQQDAGGHVVQISHIGSDGTVCLALVLADSGPCLDLHGE
jgi:hypothetical protein